MTPVVPEAPSARWRRIPASPWWRGLACGLALAVFFLLARQGLSAYMSLALDENESTLRATQMHMLARGLEEHKARDGSYPTACGGLPELMAAMEWEAQMTFEPLHYCSDGRTYVMVLRPFGAGGCDGGHDCSYDMVDGRWVSWPSALPPRVIDELGDVARERSAPGARGGDDGGPAPDTSMD